MRNIGTQTIRLRCGDCGEVYSETLLTGTQTIRLRCGDCGEVYSETLLTGVTVQTWIADVRSLRCPKCGAGSRRLFWVWGNDEERRSD